MRGYILRYSCIFVYRISLNMTTTLDVDAVIDSAVVKLGFDGVREKQGEALSTFVSGKDTFVCLPTGYGKSMCYSLLPIVYDLLRKKAN